MRSTQITGWPLQSTDDDFSTQGGPWQCVRAFHTNNRVASATTISLHKAVPGNACVRSTQITGLPLQSTDNDFSTHGGPWQWVRAFHTNNRFTPAVDRQRFLYTRLPGNACVRAFHTNNRVTSAVDRQRYLYTRRALALRACVPHK